MVDEQNILVFTDEGECEGICEMVRDSKRMFHSFNFTDELTFEYSVEPAQCSVNAMDNFLAGQCRFHEGYGPDFCIRAD